MPIQIVRGGTMKRGGAASLRRSARRSVPHLPAQLRMWVPVFSSGTATALRRSRAGLGPHAVSACKRGGVRTRDDRPLRRVPRRGDRGWPWWLVVEPSIHERPAQTIEWLRARRRRRILTVYRQLFGLHQNRSVGNANMRG